jgi:hypothetical protein
MACPGCGAAAGEDAHYCVRGGLGVGDDAPAERETSFALLAVTALAALLIGGVLATLLGARGIGFLASSQAPEPAGAGPIRLEVSAVTVSSALPPAGAVDYGSENLVDGEPATAWNEGSSGDGTGEWVEVALTGPADVSRVLLWNGYQHEEAFETNNRVAELRLELSGMPFVAPLLDVEGPQVVKLPQPVRTDRIRLVIERVYPGNRYNDAAISDLEIHGEPAEALPAPPP